jgi:predicted ATP-grasp superfamily ATP-dependent carboligase
MARTDALASRPPCVVLGLHHNGLGVARALGREGIRVLAINPKLGTGDARTRYAEVIVCRDFRGTGLIDTLCAVGRRLAQPAVLIPTMDRGVELVSEHRDRIAPYYLHSLPEAGVVNALLDKVEIAAYAEREGFLIPRTIKISSLAELETAAAQISIPCILKPQLKTEAFISRHTPKAFRIRSMDELRATYADIATAEPNFVLQEWIPGPDTALLFCLYYFDAGGNPVATFSGRKLRQFIPYCGTACSAEPWDDEFVREAGIRFFQRCAYRGFGAIEFKRDPDGRYFLMEPTVGRTEHLFALAAANGVNLPYIGYCDMAGLPVVAPSRTARPVKYMYWKRDFRAARTYMRAGDLSVSDWLTSLRGAKQFPLFAWDDPKPFYYYMKTRLLGRPRRAVSALQLGNRLDPVMGFGHEARVALRRVLHRPTTSGHAHLHATVTWLAAAQDASGDGGVARGYTVRKTAGMPVGWQPSYPETTGYIIPTLFESARHLGRDDCRERAIRMADWLLGFQAASGGVPGGVVGEGRTEVAFNTGMVLHGLCHAYRETGELKYLTALQQAADFLVAAQDPDGAWRRFSHVTGAGDVHAFDVLICWPLLLAYAITGNERHRAAAARNVDFTLTLQRANAWFESNGLRASKNARPLTHTIAYTAAGLLEAGVLLHHSRSVAAAERLARAVQQQLDSSGRLAGEFYADWRPASRWSCLTGNVQMAIVWMRLGEVTGTDAYAMAAERAIAFTKERQDLTSRNPGIRGGIAGSYPFHGRYGRFQYLNWAAKFFADALLLESGVRRGAATEVPAARKDATAAGARP